MKPMFKSFLPGVLVVLVQAVVALSAHGQAAVEYGAAASKSTAMTSRAATASISGIRPISSRAWA